MANPEAPVLSICSSSETCEHYAEFLLDRDESLGRTEPDCDLTLTTMIYGSRHPVIQRAARAYRCPYMVWESMAPIDEDEGNNA